MLAFQRHGVKMTEFGLATIFGSVVFCITFVPAVAYYLNYGCRRARPEPTEKEKEQNASLLRAFARDMSFMIACLVLYYLFMSIETLALGQCICLIGVFVVYVAFIGYQ